MQLVGDRRMSALVAVVLWRIRRNEPASISFLIIIFDPTMAEPRKLLFFPCPVV